MRGIHACDQGECHPVFAQHFEKIPADPILIANLQSELELLGQTAQKRLEQVVEGLARRKGVAIEIGKLQQQRTQAVAQERHVIQERSELGLAVFQHLFVRDHAGNLGGKDKSRRGFIAPARHYMGRRNAVVGGIDLDSGKLARVGLDELSGLEVGRVKGSEPIAARPTGGADE